MNSKNVLGNASSESVKSAKEIGKQQYKVFVTERLKSDNIKKKNLALFWYKNDTVTSKRKQKIFSLNSDR